MVHPDLIKILLPAIEVKVFLLQLQVLCIPICYRMRVSLFFQMAIKPSGIGSQQPFTLSVQMFKAVGVLLCGAHWQRMIRNVLVQWKLRSLVGRTDGGTACFTVQWLGLLFQQQFLLPFLLTWLAVCYLKTSIFIQLNQIFEPFLQICWQKGW